MGDFGSKFRGVSLVEIAESEHPRLTNGEIILEEFQPIILCDHNSPTSQTDRQTTCDRNTALCTKVHRAVKTRNRGRAQLGAARGTSDRKKPAEIQFKRLQRV